MAERWLATALENGESGRMPASEVIPVNAQLIFPMVFYVFYMWLLALLNLRTRMGAIRSGEIQIKYFRAYQGSEPSEQTTVIARHYDNQFQLPMLFFAICCAHLAFARTTELTVILAWLFALTRLAHSFIHLGKNDVRKRAAAFAAGWLVILVMTAQLGLLALS